MTMAQLGVWTKDRMQYNASGVRASFVPDQGTITLTATKAAVIPVTGLTSSGAESYGGQWISHIALAAGQSVVLSTGTGGTGQSGSVSVAPSGLPEHVAIQDVRPNPFTQSTTITLALPQRAQSHLVVYDVSGRVVRTLADGVLEAGIHPITWNGRSDAGMPVARGVYFAKLESGGLTSARRIVLIR